MDSGLDTGDILFQRIVEFPEGQTLSSSYEILQSEIIELFSQNIDSILALDFAPLEQNQRLGSAHKSIDKEIFFEKLSQGWLSHCSEVEILGRNLRESLD